MGFTDDQIAALKAPVAPWQPIDTAPKDGTTVDLFARHAKGFGTRIPYAWWVRDKWVSPGHIVGPMEDWTITYWMPIPEPPR